jgi:hypothetical protein
VELATAARGALGLPLGPLVVNALPSEAPTAPPLATLLDRLRTPKVDGTGGGGGNRAATPRPEIEAGLQATLRLAASAGAQRRLADTVLTNLRRDPGLPIVTLPRLAAIDLGQAEIAELAAYFNPQQIA